MMTRYAIHYEMVLRSNSVNRTKGARRPVRRAWPYPNPYLSFSPEHRKGKKFKPTPVLITIINFTFLSWHIVFLLQTALYKSFKGW